MRFSYDAAAALRNLEDAQRLAPDNAALAARMRDARVEAAPPMLHAALPKSGRVFVFQGLTDGTGKGRVSGVQGGADRAGLGRDPRPALRPLRRLANLAAARKAKSLGQSDHDRNAMR